MFNITLEEKHCFLYSQAEQAEPVAMSNWIKKKPQYAFTVYYLHLQYSQLQLKHVHLVLKGQLVTSCFSTPLKLWCLQKYWIKKPQKCKHPPIFLSLIDAISVQSLCIKLRFLQVHHEYPWISSKHKTIKPVHYADCDSMQTHHRDAQPCRSTKSKTTCKDTVVETNIFSNSSSYRCVPWKLPLLYGNI